jgi:carbonic anhydrase
MGEFMLDQLKADNRAAANRMAGADGGIFKRLGHRQTPDCAWVGCAGSRGNGPGVTIAGPRQRCGLSG